MWLSPYAIRGSNVSTDAGKPIERGFYNASFRNVLKSVLKPIKKHQRLPVLNHILLLLAYSLGLGLPFLLSALLIDQLSGAFTWIKKHYRIINLVCGIFLILVGVLMACGMMNRFVALLK